MANILQISTATLWRLKERKEDPIPSVRVGKRVMFLEEQVHEWLIAQSCFKGK